MQGSLMIHHHERRSCYPSSAMLHENQMFTASPRNEAKLLNVCSSVEATTMSAKKEVCFTTSDPIHPWKLPYEKEEKLLHWRSFEDLFFAMKLLSFSFEELHDCSLGDVNYRS
ncbi:hypothetical protein Dimus_022746 [Dionaea muscipula]